MVAVGIYNRAIKKLNQLNDIRLRRKLINTNINTTTSDKKASLKNSLSECILEIVPTKKTTQVIGKNWLANYFDNQASEHGEDGIVKKIFEIMPPENKWVCEFGAHDPEIISNSWRLINKEGWSAVLIEGDDTLYNKLKDYYSDKKMPVTCIKKMVSYEGDDRLDSILSSTQIPANPDLMIIDIDGNDFHVWEALSNYQPTVVMIEFNAAIPLDISFTQEKKFSLNQGSSLRAMVNLAKLKNYRLIAVTSWNAFFVKSDRYHLFFSEEPMLEEMYVYPAKHPIEMRAFQLYDGTLVITHWSEMLWHSVDLGLEDYQALPLSYRVFKRELACQDAVYERDGKRIDTKLANQAHLEKIFSKPSNKITIHAKNEYSRYGEDGIIDVLARIVSSNHLYFVDVGAWDGITHSKTRNLAVKHSWSGLAIEENTYAYEKLCEAYALLSRVKTVNPKLGLDGDSSLDIILKRENAPLDPDVMSITLFGQDYYVWESLQTYRPKVVAVQFNPTIQNDVKFVQSNNFDLHQGCSLRALLELGNYKGYELVGVTLETAFFIDRKYAYRFFEVIQASKGDLDDMFEPLLMRLYQLYDGTLNLEGLDRFIWNNIPIDIDKIQVIPKSLRKFHQHADSKNKKHFYRV